MALDVDLLKIKCAYQVVVRIAEVESQSERLIEQVRGEIGVEMISAWSHPDFVELLSAGVQEACKRADELRAVIKSLCGSGRLCSDINLVSRIVVVSVEQT